MDSERGTEAATTSAASATATGGLREVDQRQHAGYSVEPAAAEGQRLSALDGIRFDCIRGAIYHEDRERHYALVHRIIMLVTIATSMAAIVDPLRAVLPVTGAVFPFVAGVAAVVDLVWDVSGKARLHATLKRVAYDLLADAEEPDADPVKLRVRIMRSLADEPPTMWAVNALAFNKAAKTLGRPKDCRMEISPEQIRRRHWRSYSEADFPDPA